MNAMPEITQNGRAPSSAHHLALDIRGEEVQDIINQVPSGLVRWGTAVFFCILVSIVFGSYLIKYPDLIKAPFKLTSQNSPKLISARTDGKLTRLLVKNNQQVKKDDMLAYLESTASHAEVLSLASWVSSVSKLITTNHPETIGSISRPDVEQLGELQANFQIFDQTYIQFLSFQTGNFYPAKRKLLQQDLVDLGHQQENLRAQRELYYKNYELAQEDYLAQKKLVDERVIAPLEFKKEESKFLIKAIELKRIESELVNNSSAQTAKQKELLELDKLISEQKSYFMQSLNTLKSTIEAWKQKFILVAPVAGQVCFFSFLEESQPLANGQEVFYIASKSERQFGEVYIPQNNFGKIKVGQDVLIKFDGYPSQEFGTVRGRVEFISQIPNKENVFLAKVLLPKGLVTTYKKNLTYKTGMTATAEIITADVRLIEKVFYNFKKALAE